MVTQLRMYYFGSHKIRN